MVIPARKCGRHVAHPKRRQWHQLQPQQPFRAHHATVQQQLVDRPQQRLSSVVRHVFVDGMERHGTLKQDMNVERGATVRQI